MNQCIRQILTTLFVFAILIAAGEATARAQDSAPLDKDGLLKTITFMKQTNSSDQEIAQVVSNTGVGFKPTKDDEKQLRQAGASDSVIAAVRGSYRGEETNDKPAATDNQPPTATEDKNEAKPRKVKPPKETKPAKTQKTTDAGMQTGTRDETANQPPQNDEPRERREQPKQQKQDKDIKFNVGDRVEVDTFMRGDYAGSDQYARWRPGKIIGIENAQDRLGFYVVQVDEDGSEMRIRFRTRDVRWIRAPQGPQ